jgi:ferrochelatase
MATCAILLANLGSPDSPSVEDVKTYLDEFLMDEKVIDVPYWLRYLLVKGIIVPVRSPKSAEKYATIWTKDGSPLIHITEQLTRLVATATGLPAYMCMRYANPAPKDVLAEIARQHPDLKELVLFPLYPHFAMSSYETAVEHVQHAHRAGGYAFQLTVTPPYFEDERYVKALAESIRPYLDAPYDQLLFSYHGVPERHLRKSDFTGKHCLKCEDCCNVPSEVHSVCYRHQVIQTTRLATAILGIPENKYSWSFQSRLGPDKWLEPSTASVLKEMPGRGIKNLVIVCPAFVSDCLETLEEIQVEGKEIFEKAGGRQFTPVPCLNLDANWVETVCKLIKETRQGPV